MMRILVRPAESGDAHLIADLTRAACRVGRQGVTIQPQLAMI
ncbi:hypothetical protein ACFS07_23135 [Undibacterium arcticum]